MKITVQANSGEFSFECGATERILQAGLEQGLRLPYECATGTCGTCRGRVVQGTTLVEWEEAPGFARLKRAKGDVLMCQTRPTTDCVVRVPANLVSDPDSPTIPHHRRGRIEGVRRLVRDVIEIDIGLSRPVMFDAGQFVVLEVPGLKGGRAYSMVNYARDSARLTFVIKQKPGGGFSDWLFGSDVGGAELDVFGPLGAATFRPMEGRNILCIAGGSGIAGMLAILEHARSENYFRDHRAHVFFGVRGLADGFYLQEMSDYVAAAQWQAAGHAGALARGGACRDPSAVPSYPARQRHGDGRDDTPDGRPVRRHGELHRRPDADGGRGPAPPHSRRPPTRRLRALRQVYVSFASPCVEGNCLRHEEGGGRNATGLARQSPRSMRLPTGELSPMAFPRWGCLPPTPRVTPTRCVQRLRSAAQVEDGLAMADLNRGRTALPPRHDEGGAFVVGGGDAAARVTAAVPP